MPFDSWLLFTFTVVIVGISPGPNVLIVIAHSIKYGWKTAVFTIMGNIVCLFLIALLAALGVGALLHAQPIIYMALKIIGACYLIYMGINIIRATLDKSQVKNDLLLSDESDERPSGFKLITQAFLVSASNPKSVIFLSAFFPQFLNKEVPLIGQFSIMFATIIVTVICVHLTYALMASAIRNKITTPKIRNWISRVTGITFIGLGGSLVLSE